VTLYQILQNIRKTKPTEIEDRKLIRWISELDQKTWDEVFATHEGMGTAPSLPYGADLQKKALIPFPHEDIYEKWLEAMIDFENADFERYNNSMMMFQSLYNTFIDWYHRNHMPNGANVTGWKGGRLG